MSALDPASSHAADTPLDPATETPMLDVHPPHGALHGWRDFVIHIATITIGLLIAIGLEQTVEYIHHRHIVAEARENIRHEIEYNQEQGLKDLRFIKEDADRIATDLNTIRQLRQKPKDFHGSLAYRMEWSSFNKSAWNSARDMGALTYMPYDEVQKYADLYERQEMVNQQADTLFTRQTQALTPFYMWKDMDALPDEDSRSLLRETAYVSVGLMTLDQIIHQLNDAYTEALKK